MFKKGPPKPCTVDFIDFQVIKRFNCIGFIATTLRFRAQKKKMEKKIRKKDLEKNEAEKKQEERGKTRNIRKLSKR
jgi:hypothetical protein